MNMEDPERNCDLGNADGQVDTEDTLAIPAGDSGGRYNYHLQSSYYVFGNKILDKEFKAHVAKEISSTGPERYKYLKVETIEYAYANTMPKDDTLRVESMRALFSRSNIFQAVTDGRLLEIMASGDDDQGLFEAFTRGLQRCAHGTWELIELEKQ
jgi:hypothetical protein